MLGISVEDAAELFGGSAPVGISGDGYFAYENAAAGFALFYPRRLDESEPRCMRVMLYEPADASVPWRALPWKNADEYDSFLVASGGTVTARAERVSSGILFHAGAGEYLRVDYADAEKGVLFSLWSREAGGDAVTLIWETTDGFSLQTDASPTEDEKFGAHVEDMLRDFGLLPASSGGGDIEAGANPYYGERSVEPLLMNRTSDGLRDALDALGDYMLNAELRAANELQIGVLEERRNQLEKFAVPNESAVKALAARVQSVELRISACVVAMSRAEERLGAKLSGYDVPSALLIFDPSKLNAEAFRSSVISGGAADLADAKDKLLDAELAYQRLILAQTELAAGSEALAAAREAFSVGRLGVSELEDTQISIQELAMALYEALRALSRELTALDQMTGWRLSAERGRFAQALDSVVAEETEISVADEADAASETGGK
jgi:hypothetical protein